MSDNSQSILIVDLVKFSKISLDFLQIEVMSDNGENIRLVDISRYSRICLEFINTVTSEIIELLEKITRGGGVSRKNSLDEIRRCAFEVCDAWQGLEKHFTRHIFVDPISIPTNHFDFLTSQQHQISFLINFVKSHTYKFCSTSTGPTNDNLSEFKACFELLKSHLEGSLEISK
jgi:hypothetical protein